MKFKVLMVAAAMVAAPLAVSQMTSPVAAKPVAAAKKVKPKAPRVVTTKSGLKYQDLRVGKGAVARAGKMVSVHYRGRLTNGKIFDESYKRRQPFDFQLGAGMVIKGWDEGVAGMRVGGKRKLIIPAKLAYGNRAMGDVIPANSTLIFEVELLKVG